MLLHMVATYPSFLRLNNIPVCVHNIFFTYSSTDGHLGFFLYLGYCEQCCNEHEMASISPSY